MNNTTAINSCQNMALPYLAGPAVPNSVGAEIGFASRDPHTGAVQRTGIGFYIRSDHAANCQYDLAA